MPIQSKLWMGAFRLNWMNQYQVQCTKAWTPTCTIYNWSDPIMKSTPGDLSLAIEQVQIFEINWSLSRYPTFSDQYLRWPPQKGRFGQICGGGSKMKCVPTTTFFLFSSQSWFVFVPESFYICLWIVPECFYICPCQPQVDRRIWDFNLSLRQCTVSWRRY